jgi:integrase
VFEANHISSVDDIMSTFWGMAPVATILLSMGTNPKVVQELLGHNRIQETMDTYSHVLPAIHGEAIKRLEDVLWE